MKKIDNYLRLRRLNKIWYNYYYHLLYCYQNIFFNSLIFRGNKLRAFNNFLEVKNTLKIREKNHPYLIFLVAMMSVSPNIFIMPKKLGKFTHGIPFPITLRKKIIFGAKWSIKLLKDSKKVLKVNDLATLLINSIYGEESVAEKKELFIIQVI